ncbi:uncharacterized protein Hen1 [Temnothorax nylanderi]|uniref:uncharacterized protein Hen1 n=1 Tax=Temnothorax nylanderi TaxID=102681 RepID=UPI003A89A578
MVGLLFHVLYLLGKCIYDRYRVRRTTLLPDIATEDELFEQRDDTLDPFDDVPEWEVTSWWTHKTINNFCPPAYVQRYCAVTDVLNGYKGKLNKVVDFGCAELGFLHYLKAIPEVQQILCVDVDREILETYQSKAAPLITEMLSCRERKLTIEICEGSVTHNDVKLKHANAVICIELIEHLYPDTLLNLPFNIFGYIKPEVAIITTPNAEFNVVFPRLSGYRHPDHKFEWTRKQFQDWAQNIVVRYPYYSVTFHGICNGPEGTEELGALTQMAVFHRILPRDQSIIEILTPDEYVQLNGQQGLFKTVAEYNYHMGSDSRSDEQKILDDAIYYIHYLSYDLYNEESPRNYEIYLDRILFFMTKYTLSRETLRSILTDAGWSVVDRENGPVVLNPSEPSSDDEMLDEYYEESDNDEQTDEYEDSSTEEPHITNQGNVWDYVTESPINEMPADANEEYLSQQNPHNESLHEEFNATNEIPDANEYLSEQNPRIDIWHEESNFTDEERWNYRTNPRINDISADENEEHLSERILHPDSWRDSPDFTDEEGWDYQSGPLTNEIHEDANEEYSSAENPHIENWHEEPSIIIPENYSINQENTYLFDGENSLVEEAQPAEEPCATYDDIKRLEVRNTAESLVYTERELPSDSIPLTLNEVEELEEARVTASAMSAELISLQLENSIDSIIIEPTVLQNDQINLRTTQEIASMLNFQSHMPVSRSSTSPASLCFGSEMDNSLQDFSAYNQNQSSINNQCLLNSTFCQSEIAEAAVSTEESTVKDIPCFKESFSEKDTQGSELNFLSHTPSNYYNYDVEQGRDISDKNQICEDSDLADVMSSDACSSNFNNQPKYTSSPRTKISATGIVSKSYKHKKLMPAMNSNVLLGTIEKIEEAISDSTNSSLLESSQKSNNRVTETINVTSSSSDVMSTSKYDIDFSASNSTRQKLCLENKKFSGVDSSISTELMLDTNHEITENDIINHESDVVDDIQNIDAHHVLSLGNENVNHKDESVYCTLAKTDHTDPKAHLENMTSDLAESSMRKKGLNPPRELVSSNSKSHSVNKCSSSDCAKETSVLKNDRFLPCKSSEENTSNVHFTSLKSEEIVGISKAASNIAGLANNVEAKPSSPLETPPNSWSPEIMDSGYPNSASAQDITPEYDLSSIAQDQIPDSESPSVAEAPRLGVLEPIEVENGDLANNNRDDEGNNMMAVDANDIENLQPLIDVLENDLENENDIYVMQNGFPIWLLRILDMANPLDFDMQARQNLRIPDEVADDANYVVHDEGFDSSSESESDIAYNEMENDNGHGK